MVIEVPLMEVKAIGRELRSPSDPKVEAAVTPWPPADYVAVLVPVALAYELVAQGKAIAVEAVFEKKEG